MAVQVTRLDMTAKALRAEAAKHKDAKAARRILAIAMVLDGHDRTTAAQTCGMDRQTLRDWVHRYNAEGLAGLSNRGGAPIHYTGRPCALSDAQKEQLSDWVRRGPDPRKDGVVRWRRVDLKRKIAAEFGVEMHERTVGKQLAKLGFRRLSVRPQHPGSDPEAQDAFKKTSRTGWQKPSLNRPVENLSKSGFKTKPASANRAH